MDPATTVRLVLEADLDGDSISGVLSGAGDEEPLRFSGWLGLVAAIDAAARRSVAHPVEARRLGGDLLEGGLDASPAAEHTPMRRDTTYPSPIKKGEQP